MSREFFKKLLEAPPKSHKEVGQKLIRILKAKPSVPKRTKLMEDFING